jgi:hypothetical protein
MNDNISLSPLAINAIKKSVLKSCVWYAAYIFEVLLAFRFALGLAGVNPYTPFGDVIYSITDALTFPFSLFFKPIKIGAHSVEWFAVFAMIFYVALARWIVHSMIAKEEWRKIRIPEFGKKEQTA